ncbi:2-dehydropantoate 2-reductase (Ketopantoate reductase) (KPA reductase) (KPR) [Diatrype stigma]|uniref:2-dehydropantoate 2-reductase (Ketopantoate reductase) (KPA reductase) (KPR) n=1 Tax=Diatrype stigma TaxID=117547 RepID=A0AAN9YTK3_9PEZI
MSRVAFSHQRSRQAPARWLQELLQDTSKPPTMYAWTPANLPGPLLKASRQIKEKGEQASDLERRRIYVLGMGNIGRLFASSLAKQTHRPPITLVVHRRELLEHWLSDPGIEMTALGKSEKLTDFDIEWWTDQAPVSGPVREPAFGGRISNLIICTKAPDCMPQIDRLRGYLDDTSSVALVHNGMCKLWPPSGDAYIKARFPQGSGPDWIACVTTHGVTSLGPFRSLHASLANVLVGPVRMKDRGGSGANYLLKQIADAPGLGGRLISTGHLWIAQLEKLVVNSVINPLTTILRCKNGEIAVERDDLLPAIIDRLIDEASQVLKALILDPSSDGILPCEDGATPQSTREDLLQRFSTPRLREMFYKVAAMVAENRSSMLQDAEADKKTEINDFNGWLVEIAEYLDPRLALPTHKKLMTLVGGNVTLKRNELDNHFQYLRPA